MMILVKLMAAVLLHSKICSYTREVIDYLRFLERQAVVIAGKGYYFVLQASLSDYWVVGDAGSMGEPFVSESS